MIPGAADAATAEVADPTLQAAFAGDEDAQHEVVTEMAATIAHALFKPGGMYGLLPPEHASLLWCGRCRQGCRNCTVIEVRWASDDNDHTLVAKDLAGGGSLVGLFTFPPANIAVFASAIRLAGYDEVDVTGHECGHRFGLDHDFRRPFEAHSVVAPPGASGQPADMYGHQHITDGKCPVCLIHTHAAVVMGLLTGLRVRSHLQHQVPLGAGGTIPQARALVVEIQAVAAVAATGPLADRQGQVREIDGICQQLQDALAGWLEPEDVSVAAALSEKLHDRAWDVNHAYWLHVKHGDEMAH